MNPPPLFVLLQQQAQGDFTSFIGNAGPLAALTAMAGFLLKAWLESRKEKREEKKGERESESGIVETTKEALGLVRIEMNYLKEQVKDLRQENEALKRRVTELELENSQLRGGRRRGNA